MRLLLTVLFTTLFCSTNAQIIEDSLSTGPNNENQTWYNLDKGVVHTKPLSDWHLGFEISGITSSILINSASGNELYHYPNGDTSNWDKIDTTGLSEWKRLYNSDTSWLVGAFNQGLDPKNELDLGWGAYNMSNHWVVGDSLYLVKLTDGSWKKLWLERLAGGAYDFKYANLDGTNEKTSSLSKADFSGKNFGYFNLEKGTTVDIEPSSEDWDLLFTKYTTLIPTGPGSYFPYGVSGVLSNKKTAVTKIYPVEDPDAFKDHKKASDRSPINEIGYAWKKFDFNTSTYEIEDSTVYLVKKSNGAVWKIVMTGYSGTTTGQFNFYKELLGASSTSETSTESNDLIVYPTLVKRGETTTITSSASTERAELRLISLDGKVHWRKEIAQSFTTYHLPTTNLQNGMYILQLRDGANMITQKIIVQ